MESFHITQSKTVPFHRLLLFCLIRTLVHPSKVFRTPFELFPGHIVIQDLEVPIYKITHTAEDDHNSSSLRFFSFCSSFFLVQTEQLHNFPHKQSSLPLQGQEIGLVKEE